MDCVTVLLATYNQEKYIYEAINSVLIQDYQNIQLIIADDGSDYFLPEEIEAYIREKNRGNITACVALKNKENLGTVRNLNHARKYVMGRYVIPLSGDDQFFDEKVITNYVAAFRDNKEAEVIVSQVLHYDQELKNVMFRCVNEEQIQLLREGNNRKIYGKVCTECFIPAIGSAYAADMLKRVGDYDERYYLVEDWPYFLKMLRKGVKFGYADFVSAKHRDGGVSHSKRNKAEERKDRYHQDLIAIIRNEILPNYQFADEAMQKSVYHYANDRIVISEFRKDFRGMTRKEQIMWLFNHYYLPGVVWRGVIRKLNFWRRQ